MNRSYKSSPGGSTTASLTSAHSVPGKRTLVESLSVPYKAGPGREAPASAPSGARSGASSGASPAGAGQPLAAPRVRMQSLFGVAAQGTSGAGGALPHLDAIQRSFGPHDVSGVTAHTGSAASAGARTMQAEAFAFGNHVAFDGAPDLHTAAHEAAHVVQQRGGVQLEGGVGEEGDDHERHADAVADLVVQGRSAAHLLDAYSGGAGAPGVQAKFNRTLRKKELEDQRKNEEDEQESAGETVDLDGLTIEAIELLVSENRLEVDQELVEYLTYRARKDFYAQLHVVYDLDETLVGHTTGKYVPSKDPHELGGAFVPDEEDWEYPIHGIAPGKPLGGDHTSQFTPIDQDRQTKTNQWRMRYREKDLRERGESQKGSNRRGGDDEEDVEKQTVEHQIVSSKDSSPRKETIIPSNLKETKGLKGFSVRPGAIENLKRYHLYGIKQSTWTHNSDHHSHRVHELLEQQGFAESNFAYRHNRETQTDKDDKSLMKLRDKDDQPGDLTVLLDDQPHGKSNTPIGNVSDEAYGKDESGEGEHDEVSGKPRFVELRMVPFADPKDRKKKKKKENKGDQEHQKAKMEKQTDHLGGLLGERMIFKLALMQKKQGSKAAARYLSALGVMLQVEDEKALPEAFGKFIENNGDATLQQQFEKFQPKPRQPSSLFALTPSLGASLLLPTEKKGEQGKKDDSYVEDSSGNAYIYKAQNVVSRGLIETVTREDDDPPSRKQDHKTGEDQEDKKEKKGGKAKRYVRVYQTLVNQVETRYVNYKDDVSSEDLSGRKNKDIHQDKQSGQLHLIKGSGAVCYSVGTPLRALKWVEKYHHEHKDNEKIKGFVPVIRSFLLPIDVYLLIASKAMVQEQMSHGRYLGKESSPNVDIGGDTDQYEMRESDFELFKEKALSGSLVTWTEAPGKIDVDVSGEVHDLRELYEQLGIPYLPGIFTPEFNPFVSNKKHREGGSARKLAGELGDAYASHLEQKEGRDVESLSSNQWMTPEKRKKALDKVLTSHFGKEAEGKKERIQRIHQERLRRIQQLENQGTRPPVTWSDDDSGAQAFFLDEILPAGATQAEIIATINENLEGERSELTAKHPEHGKNKEELLEEWEKARNKNENQGTQLEDLHKTQLPQHLPDTPMRQVDFGKTKQENQEIREKGGRLSEIIQEVILSGSCDARVIVDGFLDLFPELKEKFEVDSNENEYKFYEHAQAVIGQYLKYFATEKHPLISADSMIKMILFHDMDKRLGRVKLWKGMKEFHKTGKGYPEESAKEVHRHLPHSRAELAKKFASVDEKDSEHVLPALMMQKYAPLWKSGTEAQIALQMMNGDPIGECLKSSKKDVKEAFRNILVMARRCGIPYHDHAGLRAFFHELAQFYQSDSSSYSSDSRFTTLDKEEKRGIGKGPHGQVYMETPKEELEPGDKNEKLLTPDEKTGFIPFRGKEQGEAFEQLLEMFDDPAKTMMELRREEKTRRNKGNDQDGDKEKKGESGDQDKGFDDDDRDGFDLSSFFTSFGDDDKQGGNQQGKKDGKENGDDDDFALSAFFEILNGEREHKGDQKDKQGESNGSQQSGLDKQEKSQLEGAKAHRRFANQDQSSLTSFFTVGGGDCGIHAMIGTPQEGKGGNIAHPDVDNKRLALAKAIALQYQGDQPHRQRYIRLLADLAKRLYMQFVQKDGMTTDDEALWKAFAERGLIEEIAKLAKQEESAYQELGTHQREVVRQYLKIMLESRPGAKQLVAFLVQEVLKSNAKSDEEARSALEQVDGEKQPGVLLSQGEVYLEGLVLANLRGLLDQATQVEELDELCKRQQQYHLDLESVQGFFIEFATKHLQSLLEAYATAASRPGFYLHDEDLRVLADLENTGFTLYQQHDTNPNEFMVVDSYAQERGNVDIFHNGTDHYERAEKKER